MQLEVDNRGGYRIEGDAAEPLVFEPRIDWDTFEGKNIIHDY